MGPGGVRLDDECVTSLRAALQRYLDLMYDCDVSRFDDVFAPTVQLHGFRDGAMQCWPAGVCRDIIARRQSPKSLGAPREDALLLLDFASPDPGADQGAGAHRDHAVHGLPDMAPHRGSVADHVKRVPPRSGVNVHSRPRHT